MRMAPKVRDEGNNLPLAGDAFKYDNARYSAPKRKYLKCLLLIQ